MFRVVSITRIVPYGRTRLLNHQIRAARWDITAMMSLADDTPQTYNICVTALSPVRIRAPFTVFGYRFRFCGWNYLSTAANRNPRAGE